MTANVYALQYRVVEWAIESARRYGDPFNDVEVDVVVSGPGGQWRVPAFWGGDHVWRVRFAAREPGEYRWRSECTDRENSSLHGVEGTLRVEEAEGAPHLLQRGAVRVSADRRHFEHCDGTPFFWLADTWWMGLCRRLGWPEEFQSLAADRLLKGFSVIQIVAGLYPDMPPFDERGANEVGFPWKEDYSRINPAYFDMADLRIWYLVQAGLVPCIVGFWSYFIPWMGERRVKQHWRNLVARYGAYPVFWCLGGEGLMPYYLSKNRDEDAAMQKKVLSELARYVRGIDAWRHPITVHPTSVGRDQVEDPSLVDFDMLQTGHGGVNSVANTLAKIREAVAREPRMPALVGEVNYEGILEGSRQEIQRMCFWLCVLSGAAGHTYGANGIWQLNRPERPFGPSPHGTSWGDTPWQEASRLPGSADVALGKRILERFQWWRFEPHPEWMEPHATEKDPFQPVCAGISGRVRVAYLPTFWTPPVVKALEAGAAYRATYINPSTGVETVLGTAAANEKGEWPCPRGPIFRDWVLVLERV